MQIIFWLVLLPLGVMAVVAWLYNMPDWGAIPRVLRIAHSRSWGEYRRFCQGKLWAPGESETYRARLFGVTAYSTDRHMQIQQRTTCIVTNRRVAVCDERSHFFQLLAGEIRTVRTQRTFDLADGYSYSVVVGLVQSNVHDPDGDLRLICASQEQSHGLASAIEDMCSVLIRT
ncbi:MAG TPA: hypothetical protein VF898_06040 [Chloroflexota bacterium]